MIVQEHRLRKKKNNSRLEVRPKCRIWYATLSAGCEGLSLSSTSALENKIKDRGRNGALMK